MIGETNCKSKYRVHSLRCYNIYIYIYIYTCTIFVLNLPQTTQLQQAIIIKNYSTVNGIP